MDFMMPDCLSVDGLEPDQGDTKAYFDYWDEQFLDPAEPDDDQSHPIDEIRETIESWISEETNQCETWRRLPRGPGLYFVVERATSEIVYVGQAADLRDRWAKHRLRYLFNRRRDHVIWWKRFDSDQFTSPEHEEATYIVLLTPRHNQIARCNLSSLSATKMNRVSM